MHCLAVPKKPSPAKASSSRPLPPGPPPAPALAPKDNPALWEVCTDEGSGRNYWYNTELGTSTWTKPACLEPKAKKKRAPPPVPAKPVQVPALAPAAPVAQPQEASPARARAPAPAVVGDDATRSMMGLSLKAEVNEGAAAKAKQKKAGLFDDISDDDEGAFM